MELHEACKLCVLQVHMPTLSKRRPSSPWRHVVGCIGCIVGLKSACAEPWILLHGKFNLNEASISRHGQLSRRFNLQQHIESVDTTACRSATKLPMNYHHQNMLRIVRAVQFFRRILLMFRFGWVIFVVSGASFLRKTWHTLWHRFCLSKIFQLQPPASTRQCIW